jgi:exosortase K
VAEWWQGRRAPLLWWSLAGVLAAALKWHFSAAAAADLGWMLQPLTVLLRLLGGWHFELNQQGEWESVDAGIVIVKACAGINFMTLSFIAWCWMLRPRDMNTRWLDWPVFLFGALLLAWLAALLVNALRILAIVHVQPVIAPWLGASQAHRLPGIAIYLGALGLQLLIAERGRWRRALRIACCLYGALMLAVPLLSGNVRGNPRDFTWHATTVLLVLLPLLWLARDPARPNSSAGRR